MERLALVAVIALCCSCGSGGAEADGPKTPYEAFLGEYAQEVVPAWSRWRAAAWATHTQVVPGDYTRAQQAVAAYEDWRTTAADTRWVRATRELQGEAGTSPTPAQGAAVAAVARVARLFPATEQDLLARLDDKAGLQARFRLRARPQLDGLEVHPDELARRYGAAVDTAERKVLWKAMLGPSGDLKPSYVELRDLRNELARKGGWSNHMDAALDPYGLTAGEAVDVMVEVELALRPLYQELHTWARDQLAERYLVGPPDLIPAHWLPAPLGEDWSGLVHVEHRDPGPALQAMGAKQMLRGVEDWYVGAGLSPLPETFWERSSLLAVAPDAHMGKTGGASTWDIDLNGDVRVLMSARPTSAWRGAAYREFAYAHAFQARHQAQLPSPLRQQPPGALVTALGAWGDLAASRPPVLVEAGLLAQEPDAMRALLHEALLYVPFVQFGAGTVVPFEYEVYAENLTAGQMNSRWWGLMMRHQGIFPPETRTERWGDFLAVEAVVDAPGHYIDHVLATLVAFQLHDAVCRELGIDPRTADLSKHPRFGEVFAQLAVAEGVEDWQAVVTQVTGAPPSAEAMVRYFEPLHQWLQTQNAGRTPTLPSLR